MELTNRKHHANGSQTIWFRCSCGQTERWHVPAGGDVEWRIWIVLEDHVCRPFVVAAASTGGGDRGNEEKG